MDRTPPTDPLQAVDYDAAAVQVDNLATVLRAPQRDAIKAARQVWRRRRRTVINLPTGVGKTITALEIVGRALLRKHRVLWLAHRRELLDQALAEFERKFPAFASLGGIVQGDRNAAASQFTVASVQTLAHGRGERMLGVLKHGAYQLVVVDECHRSMGPQYQGVLRRLSEGADPYMLGLTATVERGDGLALASFWGELAFSFPIEEAIQDGYLVPPRFVVDTVPGYERDEDFSDESIDALNQAALELLALEVVAHTVAAIARAGEGRKGVVWTCNLEQAELTNTALLAAGVASAMVHSDMTDTERASVLARHRRGELRIVVNCDILTEGYDDPSIGLVVLARPARSKTLYLQILGRGLRLYPGKADCIVLDLAGASNEHELVVAPTIEAGRDPREPGKGVSAPQNRNPYSWMGEDRERSRFAWADVDGYDRRVLALSMGRQGYVALVEEPGQEDAWHVYEIVPRALVKELSAGAIPGEDARALGDDAVRRGGTERMADRDAQWRTLKPTDRQIELLHEHGIIDIPETRADASRLLTDLVIGDRLAKAGFIRRLS